MVTRRRFLGMLAVLPAVTALAGAGISLPRKDEVEVDTDMGKYFASPDTWYLKTTRPDGLKHFYRNSLGTEVALSEESIEAALRHMQDHRNFAAVRPTKLIVRPEMYHAARGVLERAEWPLFERWLWRLVHL